MARIITEGFESASLLFFDSINNASITSTYVRSGNYALATGSSGSYKNIPLNSELFVRFAIRSADNSNTCFSWVGSTGTILGSFRIGNNKCYVIVGSGNTATVTGNITINIDTWYLIELHIKIADGTDGLLVVKVDGVEDINYVGDTKPSTITQIGSLLFTHTTGSNLYMDDIAVNDTTGAEDNSWCGDGHIQRIYPNANGDVSQLTGSDSDQLDNYLLVDEIPNDGDTTYVESNTADQYDLYNLTSLDLTNSNVLRVWPEAVVRDTVAAGGALQIGIKNGGSEDWSSNISLLTTYTLAKGKEYKTKLAGGAWDQAALDALQVGVKVK